MDKLIGEVLIVLRDGSRKAFTRDEAAKSFAHLAHLLPKGEAACHVSGAEAAISCVNVNCAAQCMPQSSYYEGDTFYWCSCG